MVPDDIIEAAAEQGNFDILELLLHRRRTKSSPPEDLLRSLLKARFINTSDRLPALSLVLDLQPPNLRASEETLEATARGPNFSAFLEFTLPTRQAIKLPITEETMICHLRNKSVSSEEIPLLLGHHGEIFPLTQGIFIAAAHTGCLQLMTDMLEHGNDIQITSEVIAAAVGVAACEDSSEILKFIFDRCSNQIVVTAGVLESAARGRFCSHAMEALIHRCGDDVQITSELIRLMAKNMYQDDRSVRVFECLLDRMKEGERVTPEVMAAVASMDNGEDCLVMELFLRRLGETSPINSQVLLAAARNEKHGCQMLLLLIDHAGEEIVVAEEVLVAAASNSGCGVKIVRMLLDRPGGKRYLTEAVMIAAAGNSNKRLLKMLLGELDESVSILTHAIPAASCGHSDADSLSRCSLDNNNIECPIKLLGPAKRAHLLEKLTLAAAHREPETMRLLLYRHGHEITLNEDILRAAVQNQEEGYDQITLLIGTKPDCVQRHLTDRVLHDAAACEQEEILRLLRMKFDLTLEDELFAICTLRNAAIEGDIYGVRKFIDEGAPLDTKDSDGKAPLWWAAAKDHYKIVQELLETRAVDVNTRCSRGRTPVHKAASRGHSRIVRAMLEAGADPTIASHDGETPYSIAKRKNRLRIAKMIEENCSS